MDLISYLFSVFIPLFNYKARRGGEIEANPPFKERPFPHSAALPPWIGFRRVPRQAAYSGAPCGRCARSGRIALCHAIIHLPLSSGLLCYIVANFSPAAAFAQIYRMWVNKTLYKIYQHNNPPNFIRKQYPSLTEILRLEISHQTIR